ncbi:hypothetical protein AAF712_014263 [Marasmius tenuissimus]|uniref:Uncharacterized protein n=1 Tax=Marasmius tenuissimus TaxID=585030 RepID=A0ABR2ZBI1_9AGAR
MPHTWTGRACSVLGIKRGLHVLLHPDPVKPKMHSPTSQPPTSNLGSPFNSPSSRSRIPFSKKPASPSDCDGYPNSDATTFLRCQTDDTVRKPRPPRIDFNLYAKEIKDTATMTTRTATSRRNATWRSTDFLSVRKGGMEALDEGAAKGEAEVVKNDKGIGSISVRLRDRLGLESLFSRQKESAEVPPTPKVETRKAEKRSPFCLTVPRADSLSRVTSSDLSTPQACRSSGPSSTSTDLPPMPDTPVKGDFAIAQRRRARQEEDQGRRRMLRRSRSFADFRPLEIETMFGEPEYEVVDEVRRH